VADEMQMSRNVRWAEQVKNWIGTHAARRHVPLTTSIALLFFAVNILLVHPQFMPSLDEINPYDEAAYLNSGRVLLDEGEWPNYANNPLTSLFYALAYLPFHGSPYWFVLSDWLGRFIQFSLLWLSAWLVATQLARYFHPFWMLGVFLVVPLPLEMLRFPSDPLFASLAGFSFWQLLAYYNSREARHLWLASLFMGLAALARNDGLPLFLILLVAALLLSLHERRFWKALVASALPFLALVGGYVLVYGLFTGNYDMGTLRRTYDNFEAGQEIIYQGTGDIASITGAKLEARKYFGTPRENDFSILKAIRRNPAVYFQRLKVALLDLPSGILQAYGIRFTPILLLLVVRGVIELIWRKQYLLVAVLCLWPAHLATGLAITIFREGHLQFPYYVVFALACTGLVVVIQSLGKSRERYLWYTLLALLAGLAFLFDKLAVYYGAIITLAGLVVASLAKHLIKDEPGKVVLAAPLIMLCAGMVIRGGFPTPVVRHLGTSAKEGAVLYMAEHLEPGSKVASASPGPVWAAKMIYFSLIATDLPREKSSEEFLVWLRENGVTAIYVDHNLYNPNPATWALIKSQIGDGLSRVYTGDQGDIQVLVFSQAK
jgi:hypothetical protein